MSGSVDALHSVSVPSVPLPSLAVHVAGPPASPSRIDPVTAGASGGQIGRYA
jgi:hypothetical protein